MTATQWTGFHGLGPRGFPVEPSGTTPDLVPDLVRVFENRMLVSNRPYCVAKNFYSRHQPSELQG